MPKNVRPTYLYTFLDNLFDIDIGIDMGKHTYSMFVLFSALQIKLCTTPTGGIKDLHAFNKKIIIALQTDNITKQR